MKFGVDVSCYDNNIDYATFRQNIQYAIIRVGYGVSYMPDSQRDTLFDRHYSNLKGYVPLGAYYYAYATNYDQGRKEAENCLAYMGDKTFELPIFYDLEESRNTYDAGRGFVDRIREAGLKAGIYCSTSFYKNKFNGIDCDCLWLAEYGSNNGQVPSSEPRYRYDIWQYSSKGSVAGWNRQGDVDTAQDYVIDGVTPTPTPTPVPPQPIQGAVAEIQQWLNDTYGFTLAVDNDFGSHTFHALVRAYQIELNIQFGRGIAVDGDYGRETSAAYVTLREGAQGNITRICQALLICYGYDTNGFDGDFQHGTAQAVESYQRNNGLKPDKVVGRNTWDKLFQYR